MKEIGGYFEIDFQRNMPFPHENGVLLNTGRNAIEYVLRTIPFIAKVYVPYCTCHTVMQPINVLGLQYEYYHINNLFEMADDIVLKSDEYIIYTNYYGMKDEYIKMLYAKYGKQLIVDCAQGLFSPDDLCDKMVFTLHKFAGTTNGAIAFSDSVYSLDNAEVDISYERASHLFARYDGPAMLAYADFKANMRKSRNQPIRKMSNLTYRMSRNLDWNLIRQKRIANVNYLHSCLKESNLLNLDLFDKPLMAYPYWSKSKDLRRKLQENKIFCATYWPNVMEWCMTGDMDCILSSEVIPIPIDQRYDIEDMKRIIDIINNN